MNSILILILALGLLGCASAKKNSAVPERAAASTVQEKTDYLELPQTIPTLFFPLHVSLAQPQRTTSINHIDLYIDASISSCIDENELSFAINEISEPSQENADLSNLEAVFVLNLYSTSPGKMKGSCMSTSNKDIKFKAHFNASLYVSDGEHKKLYRFVSAADPTKELFVIRGRGTERTKIVFDVEQQPR